MPYTDEEIMPASMDYHQPASRPMCSFRQIIIVIIIALLGYMLYQYFSGSKTPSFRLPQSGGSNYINLNVPTLTPNSL